MDLGPKNVQGLQNLCRSMSHAHPLAMSLCEEVLEDPLVRAICPREKIISYLDASGHLIVHLLSDDQQRAEVDGVKFIKYQWVVPGRSEQDYVVDPTLAHKSELLAITSTMEFHWYSISDGGGETEVTCSKTSSPEGDLDRPRRVVKIEKLAILKATDLSSKLRKLDFPDELGSVTMLGSEGGESLLLFNMSLVCRLVLDREFGCIALVGCYVLQISLDQYEDDQLPRAPGRVACIEYVNPLLFALTTDGIVSVYIASTGISVGVINVMNYCSYNCSRQPDSEELLSEVMKSEVELISISPDLTHFALASSCNHLILVNILDYFQAFPHHYHPDFIAGRGHTKLHKDSKSTTSPGQMDTAKEEEEERRRYRPLPRQLEKPDGCLGNYAWRVRLNKMESIIDDFEPDQMKYMNFQQSTQLPKPNDVDFHLNRLNHDLSDREVRSLPSKKVWYQQSLSPEALGGHIDHNTFSTQFITGIPKPTADIQIKSEINVEKALRCVSKYCYHNHCILPAVSEEGSRVVRVDFESSLIVAYYGHIHHDSDMNTLPPHSVPASGMVLYNTGSQTYSYNRLPQPSWLLETRLPWQLVYLVNELSLSVVTFSLSQEEFVGKVLMFGNASVAEEVCHLNRWDKCSLPINALETALELRQLDTLAFFLRSRDNDCDEDVNQDADIPALPPLPPDQLDTVVQLLIGAIQRNCQKEHPSQGGIQRNSQKEHLSQFASQLLMMTLGFITRMIKGEVIREGYSESRTAPSPAPSPAPSDGDTEGFSERQNSESSNVINPSVPLTDLTSYIQQLRSYLPKASATSARKGEVGREDPRKEEENRSRPEEAETEDYVISFMDKSLVLDWNKLNSKEVIKDALLRGCLPQAQAYLLQRKPSDVKRKIVGSPTYGFDTAGLSIAEAMDDLHQGGQKPFSPSLSFRHDASLHCMQVAATGYAIEALQNRNIKLCSNILMHLGQDVPSCLRHICCHTLDRELRDFLSQELIIQKKFSEAEVAALEFLHILETYYSIQSYDQAHELNSKATSSKMSFQASALPVLPGIMSRTTSIPSVGNLQDLFPETYGGDHPLSWDPPLPSSSSSSSSAPHKGLYLQVPLAAVLCWDAATKQKLLFEGYLLRGQSESANCLRIVKKKYIFDYYVSHSDKPRAFDFLMSVVPPVETPTVCPAYITSLCSSMPHAAAYLCNVILDELARNGVFTPPEMEDFPALLHRLGRVHSLFTMPHPLSKVASQITQGEDEEETDCIRPPSEGMMVSVEAFHRHFLSYLIENRFYSLMYNYLDSYGLGLDEASISLLGLDHTDQPWVDVLLQYRQAALYSMDQNIILRASLSCANLLLSSDPSPQKVSTVMGMLQNGRNLMALATLMFAPVPLKEAINSVNSHQPWYAASSALQQAVAAYPSLQAAIFPPPPTSLTPSQSQDITFYELLQDSVPFEIGRLFKWQDTNAVTSKRDDAILYTHDLPQFSSSTLAGKYALSEHLDYVYYLRRGQPSFAFANFVASKLLGHSNTAKRIDHLIPHVYRLALLDFTNSRLGSSCAALMEMLGRDSTTLRIDLQCANRIAKYSEENKHKDTSKLSVEDNQYKTIVLQFCQLYQSSDKTATSVLLNQLESATQVLISSSGVEICGLEAEECWQLVQSFCRCHSLTPSVAFLTLCAKNGQWLALLCNAQLYSIPSQMVLTIVDKSFSNPCIKEHLVLAISSMDTAEQPTSPHASKVNSNATEKSKTRKKRLNSASRTVVAEKVQNLVGARSDLRAKFYSRVGLQKEVSPQPEQKRSQEGEELVGEEQQPLVKGPDRALTSPLPQRSYPAPLLERDLPDDLFSVIFKSQSYECSWRALLAHSVALQRPLLAILAACDEHSSAVGCTCAWLFSTLRPSMFEKWTLLLTVNGEISAPKDQLKFCAEIQWRSWSTLDLSIMLISAMKHSPSPAAHFSLALHYFDENSPLLCFLKFHEEFVLRNNYEECKKHLQEFQVCMDKCKTYRFCGKIGDTCWVEQVVSSMASHMLVVCPTPFERSRLLQLLSEVQFGENFKCSVLNFCDLHQMSGVLNEAGLASDAAFTVKEHFSNVPGLKSLNEIYSVRVRVDTEYVLGLLLERGQFDIARKYASIVKSTASQVTIKEAEYNLKQLRKSSYWDYTQAKLNFWHQCNTNFHDALVEPEAAADFFHSIVDNSDEKMSSSEDVQTPESISAMERALLLALSLKWRKQSDSLNAEQCRDLEREIWLSHIQSAMNEIDKPSERELSSSPLPFISEVDYSSGSTMFSSQPRYTSLLSSLSISAQQQFKGRRQLSEFMLPDNVSVALEGKNRTTLTHKEGEAFDMMLGRLMNAGLLSQARELAASFEHDSPDLTIVLCCIQLAQGKLTPSQLTEGVLSLVSARPPRHLNDPSTSSLDDPFQSRHASELIRMINKLSDRAIYAQQCCSCIITCFRIALALKLAYVSVITTDPYDTLTQLLSSNAADRLTLASKFITTCNIEPKEVAVFLAECVSTSLQARDRGAGGTSSSLKAQVYQYEMTTSRFYELVQLTSDPTLLGNILLDKAKTFASIEESEKNIAIQVEFLVRSHDCYTLGCSVDGISNVLVVAQNWVKDFVKRKHFKLMVRLLTGISRYHEMSYIIGLLIEHHEFENLVHTRLEKEAQLEEQLRVALIDYLHKHGNDSDKLQMVALKFNMLRELAKTTEDRAKRDLAHIKSRHLAASNGDTVKKLKVIFDNFRAAAHTYTEEDCLNNAEYCLSQARLVALQLSVLNLNKQVINLNARDVLKYMEQQPFTEALIVSDAYKRNIRADWSSALYKRVIIGGDFRYFNEYKTAFLLTPTTFSELASKYQRDRERPLEAANNMKRILTDLKNLSLRQKIMLEIGLNDPQFTYDTGYMNDIQRL